MKCPKCFVPLVISDRQGVEIDFCPQCRGVWLDRGELDKILERSSAYAARPEEYRPEQYRPQYRKDDDDDDNRYGHPRKKKRGGFLDDLFDF